MTDQPQSPGAPGTSGAWQPVPGGGDYDPDQTMHVSFAAQLPPEPRPGEDPLGAHGPVGPGGPGEPGGQGGPPPPAGEGGAATQWTIPVIRDEADSDSGDYSVGAFTGAAPWERTPPVAPTQTFPAGMFGQGAAAAQAAQAELRARAAAGTQGAAEAAARVHNAQLPPADLAPGGEHLSLTGQWAMPLGGPAGGDAVPWLPPHPPAADAAWSSAVDDPDTAPPAAAHPDGTRAVPPAGPEGTATGGAEPAAGAGTGRDPGPDQDPYDRSGQDTDPGTGPGTGLEPGHDAGHDPAADPDLTAGFDDLEPAPAPDPDPAPEPTRSEHPLASYLLRVNGTDRPVTDAWLGESLLYVLRERLGLAGAKDGCEQGECGACSVQVDGRLVASCLVPAATAAGSDVRTVEGLTVDGRPSDVQRALADCGAVQCGFCVPGMAMTVHDLLEGNHKPTDLDVRQAVSGNLCRCSGYRGVLDAVRQVVAGRADPDPDRDRDPDFAEGATDAGPPGPDGRLRVPHQGGPLPGGAV
jgi:aerobic-type carbon monoxide dehydrogenase small subunit (CoxS/CutS family)